MSGGYRTDWQCLMDQERERRRQEIRAISQQISDGYKRLAEKRAVREAVEATTGMNKPLRATDSAGH